MTDLPEAGDATIASPQPAAETSPPPRSALARRIDDLAASAPTAEDGVVREFLFRSLAERYGVDFAGARLDRDWLVALIDREIAAIDRALSDQVNAILHHPAVQRLEARWRGLRYLAAAAYESERIKVKFLSASWNELVRDLERAADFDQSELFRKVYQDEFGMPGGEPFGLMVGDYEVQHRPSPGHTTDDVSALKSLATVAAASFCPFILGVSPRVFQLDSFRDLSRPMNLRAVFAQTEYQRWLSVRDGEDMRFIGLAMPRVLIRAPYGPDPERVDGFRFDETAADRSGAGHLWANAAFAFASIVIRAFASSGWFADLRGAPRDELRGGLVTDLPTVWFATDRPGTAPKPSVECILSETHENDLADLGFVALRNMPYTPYSVFYANPSLQMAKRYSGTTANAANANARLSGMLQYMLCVSRFAHYIKVLGRERLGSTMSAEQCQTLLQTWLTRYCEGSDSASQDAKARSPLREGRIEVREQPGKPGAFACSVFLRPHFQLDDIATGFRLVTELAPPRAA